MSLFTDLFLWINLNYSNDFLDSGIFFFVRFVILHHFIFIKNQAFSKLPTLSIDLTFGQCHKFDHRAQNCIVKFILKKRNEWIVFVKSFDSNDLVSAQKAGIEIQCTLPRYIATLEWLIAKRKRFVQSNGCLNACVETHAEPNVEHTVRQTVRHNVRLSEALNQFKPISQHPSPSHLKSAITVPHSSNAFSQVKLD